MSEKYAVLKVWAEAAQTTDRNKIAAVIKTKKRFMIPVPPYDPLGGRLLIDPMKV